MHLSTCPDYLLRIFARGLLVKAPSFGKELLEYEIVAESGEFDTDVGYHSTDDPMVHLYSLFDRLLGHCEEGRSVSFEVASLLSHTIHLGQRRLFQKSMWVLSVVRPDFFQSPVVGLY